MSLLEITLDEAIPRVDPSKNTSVKSTNEKPSMSVFFDMMD